jgi:hypothetical protein
MAFYIYSTVFIVKVAMVTGHDMLINLHLFEYCKSLKTCIAWPVAMATFTTDSIIIIHTKALGGGGSMLWIAYGIHYQNYLTTTRIILHSQGWGRKILQIKEKHNINTILLTPQFPKYENSLFGYY